MPRISRLSILAFVVGTALFCTIFFSSTSQSSRFFNNVYHSAKWRISLDEEVELSEMYYQNALPEREELIRKFGPTVDKIESFPTQSQFYTLWDFFIPNFRCPHRVERIGVRGDGGKWVCGMDVVAQKNQSVIYSFGLNGESSFEAALLERAPGAQLYGYDFSVNSFGPEIESDPNLKERSHFFPWALGGKDSHGPNDDPPTYTLQTLMEMNGHTFIDILKIDIEGAEFDALSALFANYLPSSSSFSFEDREDEEGVPLSPYPNVNPLLNKNAARNPSPKPLSLSAPSFLGGGVLPSLQGPALPFGQLQLEIHAWGEHSESFRKFLKWWEKLEAVGLRPFWTEPNLVYVNVVKGVGPWLAEYSFINVKGQHELISEMRGSASYWH